MAAPTFNIFSKVSEEIEKFDKEGIYIVGRPDTRYENPQKRGERGGYYHSQRQLLEAIDLAGASKFKHGIWDDEGQRKTFLNIVNFYRDVMKMKININVANYLFSPLSLDFTWPVWVFDRQFKLWASMEDYDDQIDEYAHDLSTYGTCVSKRAAKCTERVPLRTLRNTQTAKSLYEAANNGGFVSIESEMHYNEMALYPDWDITGLDKTKEYSVHERYGLVPAGLVEKWSTMTDLDVSLYTMSADEEMVLAVAIIIPEGAGTVGKGEALLFMEKHDEDTWPLDECHIEKVDGRWIGRGEIEKQMENQISRNLNANYRRRGILWAAKKIFQSTDENIQSNLVYEVLDGQVLHPKPNGQISQVNTANLHTGDITADDNVLQENSQQQAFAFEIATGEGMPSGTPFRLGVVLSAAVQQHFTLVRETFSNFLKRSFFNQVVPIFKSEYSDAHQVLIHLGENDIEAFKDDIVTYHTNLRIWDKLVGGGAPDGVAIRAQVEQELAKNPYAAIEVPPKFYDDIRYYMKLNLTDDIGPDIADLTSLYQTMVQKGDPRAENVLKQIFATRGKAFPAIVGAAPPAAAAPAAPAAPQPSPMPSPMPAPAAAAA